MLDKRRDSGRDFTMTRFRPRTRYVTQFRLPTGLSIAGAMLLLLVIFALSLLWFKSRIDQHEFSSDRSQHQFILGNDVLEIPLNMMRFENQRTQSIFEQADLVMVWPSGAGFSAANSATFLNPDKSNDLIFITLIKRKLPMAMSERLIPVYSKLFDGAASPGPAGLILRRLKSGSGYDGEELAIADEPGLPWVARCQRLDNRGEPTCFRDLFVGSGLTLRYRFSRAHLHQWRKIEQLVATLITKIVVSGM